MADLLGGVCHVPVGGVFYRPPPLLDSCVLVSQGVRAVIICLKKNLPCGSEGAIMV